MSLSVEYELLNILCRDSSTELLTATTSADHQELLLLTTRAEHPLETDLATLRHEYQIARDKQMTHVLLPKAIEEDHNKLFLLYDNCHGYITLASWLNHQPLEIDIFFRLALAMTVCLSELHSAGIVHRDIQPENFLIHSDTLELKLWNLRSSTVLGDEHQEALSAHQLVGSLSYMSPEQTGRMNLRVDNRSDLYSLGITFYEMLTGCLPFEKDDPLELIHAHMAITADPVMQLNPHVPEPLSSLIAKLMAKVPRERYRSIKGLYHDLEQCKNAYAKSKKIPKFSLGAHDKFDRLVLSDTVYGRDKEIKLLNDILLDKDPENRKAIFISGYSGIGKTTIINEVQKPLTERRGYYIKGKFDQLQRATPYTAFTQAFHQLIQFWLTEPDHKIEERTKNLLNVLGDNARVLMDLIPDLKLILREQPPVMELAGEQAVNRLAIFFKRFVDAIATKHQPLVIFIDDLQWIDPASIRLLEILTKECSTKHLYFIGAYRNNEVSSSHPLMTLIESINPDVMELLTITLSGLTEADYQNFIKDSLDCTQQEAETIAKVVHDKTAGNPFFAKQFLELLYDEIVLHYDKEIDKWCCDIDHAHLMTSTDNVVELIAKRLGQLPKDTQKLLQKATCIGARFDITTLAMISENKKDSVINILWPALEKGLIRSTIAALEYQFVHDRIQQAAHEGIERLKEKHLHLTIGRSLITRNEGSKLHERLFEIADHFVVSQDLIKEPLEKKSIARLCIKAGSSAKNATAYDASYNYYQSAHYLLKVFTFEEEHDLNWQCRVGLATALYMTNNHEAAKDMVELLIKRVTSVSEITEIYSLKARIFENAGLHSEATNIGREAWAKLGFDTPQHISKLSILGAYFRFRMAFGFRDCSKELNKLVGDGESDEKLNAIADIFKTCAATMVQYSPLYLAYYGMQYLIFAKHNKIRKDNFFVMTLNVLMTLITINPNFSEIKNLHAIHKDLYTSISDKHVKALLDLTDLSMMHIFIPLKDLQSKSHKVFQNFLELGNFTFASYAVSLTVMMGYSIGKELVSLNKDAENAVPELEKLNMEDRILGTRIYHHYFNFLTEKDAQAGDKLLVDYNKLSKLQSMNMIARSKYIMACYHFSRLEYSDALDYVESNYTTNNQMRLYEYHMHYCLYYVMVLVSTYPEQSILHKPKTHWRLSQLLKQLKKWAEQMPENYKHLYLIAQAEIKKLRNEIWQALPLYDAAIDHSKKYEYHHYVALANERAAELCAVHRLDKFTKTYIQEAFYYYRKWGCVYKQNQLEQRFSKYLVHTEDVGTDQLTQSKRVASSADLDLITILKASQVISKEIFLETLIEKIMRVLLENAGANRVVLLETVDSLWYIVAEISPEMGKENVTQEHIPLDDYQDIPKKLINYVRHSKEPIVIPDVASDRLLTNSEYLITHHPQSIMCLPIYHHDQLQYLIYLENSLMVNAFTEDRISIVTSLATQIAISLENAKYIDRIQKLYQATERFVPNAFLQLLSVSRVEDVKLGDTAEKTITILFCDIRDYTSIMEKQTPSEAFAYLNAFLNVMGPIIRKHHGFINQYLGDGMMALFPGRSDDAIQAVIDMSSALKKYNKALHKKGQPELRLGYGMNTGIAMLGTIGDAERMDANVISDSTNLASRIENLNKLYQTEVLVSGQTLQAAKEKDRFPKRLIDKVRVKGKDEAVYLYQIYPKRALSEDEQNFIDTYEKAFKSYEAGDLKTAKKLFSEAKEQHPDDTACQILLERIEELTKKGIPKDWDGTFRFLHK